MDGDLDAASMGTVSAKPESATTPRRVLLKSRASQLVRDLASLGKRMDMLRDIMAELHADTDSPAMSDFLKKALRNVEKALELGSARLARVNTAASLFLKYSAALPRMQPGPRCLRPKSSAKSNANLAGCSVLLVCFLLLEFDQIQPQGQTINRSFEALAAHCREDTSQASA